MMTNKIKMEHYVPQFYLRNFSIENDRKSLYCFDIHTSQKFVVNIENIACEKYFYDTRKEQRFEKRLAKIESVYNTVCDKLIAYEDLNKLNWNERVSLANFVVTQEIRTKETREKLKDLCKQLKDRFSKFRLSEDFKRQLKEISTAEYPKEFQLGMFKNVKQFADIVLSMKWILAENKTKKSFWTSDHPVNRYNPIENPLGNLGYLSRGIQIFFPLTPRLSLLLCDLVEYFTYPEKMRARAHNVIFQNHLQIRSATRFIFSQDEDFSFAEKILKEEPWLKDADRKRILVQ